jgi:hypothetical protein
LEGKRNGRWWRWILAVALSLAALVLVLLRPWSRGDQAGQVALDTNTPPPTNVVGQSGTDTNQAGPSSPTNPPLPNPAAPEVPAEVFTAAQLGPVTNATGDSLPTALWPAKTAASDKLKFTYAFHRHGVVLVFFNPSDKTGKASLTCSVPKTGAQRKVALEPGGAAIFYVPGLQECSLDLDYNGQSTQQTVVPEAGEVAYRLMP